MLLCWSCTVLTSEESFTSWGTPKPCAIFQTFDIAKQCYHLQSSYCRTVQSVIKENHGKMAHLVKYMTSKQENLTLVPWIHVWKNNNNKKQTCWGDRDERILGACYPNGLAESMSSRFSKRCYLKNKVKMWLRKTTDTGLWSPNPHTYVCAHPYTCVPTPHTHEHVHKIHKDSLWFCVRGSIHSNFWPHVNHGLGIPDSPLEYVPPNNWMLRWSPIFSSVYIQPS